MATRRSHPSTLFELDPHTVTIGDLEVLNTVVPGGNDTFEGANGGSWYAAYGDALVIDGRSRGGNDVMLGGHHVGHSFTVSSAASADDAGVSGLLGDGVYFVGDAERMGGQALGGNDSIYGGWNSDNEFVGDAETLGESAKGGNDVLVGGDASMSATSVSGSETSQFTNLLFGDGTLMEGSARGGADNLQGGDITVYGSDGYGLMLNGMAGDGYEMAGTSAGGADVLTGGNAYSTGGVFLSGGALVMNMMAGDGYMVTGKPVFGADTLYGGNAEGVDGYGIAMNLMAGDALAFNEAGGFRFAGDTLYGGSGAGDGYALNMMVGDMGVAAEGLPFFPFFPDALELGIAVDGDEPAVEHAAVTYGADKLYGGENQALNFLVGDGEALMKGDRGGNDLLVGGGLLSSNMLVGDAMEMLAGSIGGNDTLVSGMGNDTLVGDAVDVLGGIGGLDVFVFHADNGTDTILDFNPNRDKIDLRALRGSDLPLTLRAMIAADRIQQVVDEESGETSVVIYLETGEAASEIGGDMITIVGITLRDLTTTNILF